MTTDTRTVEHRTSELQAVAVHAVESRRAGVQRVESPKRTWVAPDFRDVDTPMEVTAYAARG